VGVDLNRVCLQIAVANVFMMLQFEFRKKGGAAGPSPASAAKPLTESQPATRRDRSAGGTEPGEAGQMSSLNTEKSRTRDAKEKPAVQPVREWDQHKLRQSPPRDRDDRDRRAREDKTNKARERKESDRRDRDRYRHDRRGRDRNDKSGQYMFSVCIVNYFLYVKLHDDYYMLVY